MKIAIDVRSAVGQKAGKGWYTFHIVKELLSIDKENDYLLYTNAISKDIADILSAAQPLSASIKIIQSNPFLWHFSVIKDFIKERCDLFFAPTSFIIPAFLSSRYASMITVHDLVAFLHPRLHQTKATILEHIFFRMALRKTRHVLAPSENTKKDLMRLFHYPEEKITVTPLGVSEEFGKNIESAVKDAVRKKYNLPQEFVLTVGGLEPRKNIGKLVDAVISLNKKLVIVGGKGWKSEMLQKKIRSARDSIMHIENIDSADLPAIYQSAAVFVFPSLYEGFGLPPLEAMASGCPVICSRTASLPEVCGDAAIFIDPENTDELKNALKELLENEKLRVELRQKGLMHAKKFTWRKTAEKTLEVIRKFFLL